MSSVEHCIVALWSILQCCQTQTSHSLFYFTGRLHQNIQNSANLPVMRPINDQLTLSIKCVIIIIINTSSRVTISLKKGEEEKVMTRVHDVHHSRCERRTVTGLATGAKERRKNEGRDQKVWEQRANEKRQREASKGHVHAGSHVRDEG